MSYNPKLTLIVLQELPHTVSRADYYMRRLNVRKLVKSKFVTMPEHTTIEELEVTAPPI